MKFQTLIFPTILSLATIATAFPAQADTVNARCEIYPKGEDRASASLPCTFSQRQGIVRIQRQDGISYELEPVGNQPGNYVDQNGKRAYRESGLGNVGQIYRLANESVYVYWENGSSNNNQSNNSSPNRGTRIGTLRGNNPKARINLRSRATINSPTNGYGLAGDRVEILECRQDNDTRGSNLNWCQVRFPKSGAVGWVRSDFIIFPSDGE
jgi:hypothetical protein